MVFNFNFNMILFVDYVYTQTTMIPLFLLTLMMSGSETLALTLLRYYYQNPKLIYLMCVIPIYAVVIPYLILNTLNYVGIGSVNLMWNIITTTSMITIGYYVFGERVNHLHILSLLFGISSVSLLYLANRQS